MSLTIGKRDVQKMADVLEAEYDTVEDAARAALDHAFKVYESKFNFTVVGQLVYDTAALRAGRSPYIDPRDSAAHKLALGAYGTETQAKNAASALVFGQDGTEFRTWPLAVHHGTPATYFKGVQDKRKAEAMADKSPLLRELDRRAHWWADNPGALTYAPAPGTTSIDVVFGGYKPLPDRSPTTDED